MLEFVVASGKGGVGKSLVSSTLAVVLHRSLGNVIAVDADADAPNLHLLLGVERWSEEKPLVISKVAYIIEDRCTGCGECAKVCTYEAVKTVNGRYVIDPFLCEGCGACIFVCKSMAIKRRMEETGRIRMAWTKYGFPLISAKLNVGKPNSGKLVTEEKEWAKSIASRPSLIITDSAAGIGCQVIASLAGASLAILVTEPTPAGFSDLKRVYAVTRHFMMPSVLVINKFDLNPSYVRVIEEFARREGIEIVGQIPFDDKIPLSMAMMKPYIEAYPETETAKVLINIAEKIREIYLDWWNWLKEHRPREPRPYRPKILPPESFKSV